MIGLRRGRRCRSGDATNASRTSYVISPEGRIVYQFTSSTRTATRTDVGAWAVRAGRRPPAGYAARAVALAARRRVPEVRRRGAPQRDRRFSACSRPKPSRRRARSARSAARRPAWPRLLAGVPQQRAARIMIVEVSARRAIDASVRPTRCASAQPPLAPNARLTIRDGRHRCPTRGAGCAVGAEITVNYGETTIGARRCLRPMPVFGRLAPEGARGPPDNPRMNPRWHAAPLWFRTPRTGEATGSWLQPPAEGLADQPGHRRAAPRRRSSSAGPVAASRALSSIRHRWRTAGAASGDGRLGAAPLRHLRWTPPQVLPVSGSREGLFALAQTVIDPSRRAAGGLPESRSTRSTRARRCWPAPHGLCPRPGPGATSRPTGRRSTDADLGADAADVCLLARQPVGAVMPLSRMEAAVRAERPPRLRDRQRRVLFGDLLPR